MERGERGKGRPVCVKAVDELHGIIAIVGAAVCHGHHGDHNPSNPHQLHRGLKLSKIDRRTEDTLPARIHWGSAAFSVRDPCASCSLTGQCHGIVSAQLRSAVPGCHFFSRESSLGSGARFLALDFWCTTREGTGDTSQFSQADGGNSCTYAYEDGFVGVCMHALGMRGGGQGVTAGFEGHRRKGALRGILTTKRMKQMQSVHPRLTSSILGESVSFSPNLVLSPPPSSAILIPCSKRVQKAASYPLESSSQRQIIPS